MSSIPRDLASDILSYLPVKDILRFKCVSSFFSSLIESTYFTKLHLSRSQSKRFLLDKKIKEIKLLNFESLEQVPEINQSAIRPYNIIEMVGSCNGVVALWRYSSERHSISLWNPSTRKLRELPCPTITVGHNPGLTRTTPFYGFGYDYVTDDYKLVQISQYINWPSPSITTTKADIFSLKTNTWREIECPFLSPLIYTKNAPVNNALHWVLDSVPDSKILGFDLVKQEFYLVPSPHSGKDDYALGVLGGCLSTASNVYLSRVSFHLNVQVMKKYGVKESWSKLFVLPLARPKKDPFPMVIPITYSRDGTRVLLDNMGRLLWYDLVGKALNNVPVLEDDHRVSLHILCMESLVEID